MLVRSVTGIRRYTSSVHALVGTVGLFALAAYISWDSIELEKERQAYHEAQWKEHLEHLKKIREQLEKKG